MKAKYIKILFPYLLFIIYYLLFNSASAQNGHDHEHGHVTGIIYNTNTEGEKVGLPGANLLWMGTTLGTATDDEGYFHLPKPEPEDSRQSAAGSRQSSNEEKKTQNSKLPHTEHREPHTANLIVSYIGFENDTLEVAEGMEWLEVTLSDNTTLNEVVIAERVPGAHISRTETIFTQKITIGELQKAACCNLSESFETNASVDVAYSDAVTGAKHIKLLGLEGKYSQIQVENVPNIRGLASPFGLGYVPGSWMESIQVSKGTASVKNGFESITGQINVEYKKPDEHEPLFVNLYANHLGKVEGNLNGSIKLSDRWSTAWFAHASDMSFKMDHNNDDFLDMPLMRQVHVFNRWKYEDEGNIHAQFGVKYLNEDRQGGQLDHDPNKERIPENPYGTDVKTQRLEAFTKSALFFDNLPGTNMALINSFVWHDMDSYFGMRDYNATQYSYQGNLMFQSYFGNTQHIYTTGVSYMFDRYDEQFQDTSMLRVEHAPGAFFEYTWTMPDKFTLLIGARADYHNLFGFMFTPRVHFKYDITPKTVIRISAGKGYRSPTIIAENLSLLASSRMFVFQEQLTMEEAWNYGINITQYADILGRELSLSAEFYRTDFVNQAVVDRDIDDQSVYIYNLEGRSFANVFQVEAKYELIPRLEMVAAFRLNDVHTTTAGELQRETFVDRYKGLLSLSYQTRMKKWQFDITSQFNGQARLPYTGDYPEPYRRGDSSPAYTILNAQVTKYFKRWDLYVGGENLTNYKQENPIIAANDPFGEYFDASQIWGPVVGMKIYAGVRWKLRK